MLTELKEPKTFNHPRIYIGGNGMNWMRIIYPNGDCERVGPYSWEEECAAVEHECPCWAPQYNTNDVSWIGMGHFESGEKAVTAMKAYDKRYKHTTIYIGEVK